MLKRIALHIEKDKACDIRMSVAIALAKDFQAELVGIYVDYMPPKYGYEEAIVSDAFYDFARQQLVNDRNQCKDKFERRTAEAGVAAQWRAPGGRQDEALALHARCTDLLVTRQAYGRNAASDNSCDLVVMGLYGHSRAREWVLGGASREILKNMTVPVLFSH